MKSIFQFFIVLILFNSCKKENLCDCFKGTGKNITEKRQLSPFNELLVEDNIDVHIKQGNDYSATITAGSNVMSLIKTRIEDGKLKITDNNTCDFTRDYQRKVRINITVPSINKINQNGTGNVFMEDEFICERLSYYLSNSGNLYINTNANIVYGSMHGNGDVYVKGKIKSNFIYAGGQGYYNSFEASSDEMILTLNTSGSMKVSVNQFLKIDMLDRSTGNIYFKGNPTNISLNIKGTGKLIKS
jgi:hypothetical protein